MAKDYKSKLLDPRWQKKRLEILNRDNWTCTICGCTGKTLHVHHKNYIYGSNPWEYTDTNFISLCNDCHETEHECKDLLAGYIHDLLLMGHTYTSIYNFFENNHDLLNQVRK